MDEANTRTTADALQAVLEAKRLVGNAGHRLDAVRDFADEVARIDAAEKAKALQDKLTELVDELNSQLGAEEDQARRSAA